MQRLRWLAWGGEGRSLRAEYRPRPHEHVDTKFRAVKEKPGQGLDPKIVYHVKLVERIRVCETSEDMPARCSSPGRGGGSGHTHQAVGGKSPGHSGRDGAGCRDPAAGPRPSEGTAAHRPQRPVLLHVDEILPLFSMTKFSLESKPCPHSEPGCVFQSRLQRVHFI